MSSQWKLLTYSSSFTASFDSCATLATIRACDWISFRGFARSSRLRALVSLDFSSNTKTLRTAATCSGVRLLKNPLNRSSLSISSSPELISQATRAFNCTTSASLMNPNRRSTRLRHLSSSNCIMDMASLIFFFVSLILVPNATFSEYCSYSSGSRGELCSGLARRRDSRTSIF